MAFQALYTGENSAVKLPDMDRLIRSQERMSDMVIAGQEKIQQRKEKDSDFVLNQMKANPVLLISDKLRTVQSDAIKRYNDIGAKLLAKNDGILTDDDKLILQREKDALTMTQQSMQADQQRFQQEWAVIQKDQGSYYDMEEAVKGMKQLHETGTYPPTALIAKPQSFLNALAKDNIKFTKGNEIVTEMVDGVKWQRNKTTNMTPDEGRLYIADKAMSNEAYVRDLVDQFNDLPESEQLRYLEDTDGDGKVSPDERRQISSAKDINNPVIKWAQDFYLPYVIKEGVEKGTRIPTETTANFKTTIPVGGDNNQNTSFKEYEEKFDFGKLSFPSRVDLQKSTTGSVVINEYIDAGSGQAKKGTGSAELDLVAYSPSTDQIAVIVKRGQPPHYAGQRLILNAADYDDLLRRNLKIHRQGFKSYKAGATQATPKFTGSYAEYKKQYPNGTPDEYRELTGAK